MRGRQGIETTGRVQKSTSLTETYLIDNLVGPHKTAKSIFFSYLDNTYLSILTDGEKNAQLTTYDVHISKLYDCFDNCDFFQT